MRRSSTLAFGLVCAQLLACGDDGRATASAATTLPTTNQTGVTSFGTDTAPTTSGGSDTATGATTGGGGGSESATSGASVSTDATTGAVDSTGGDDTTTTTTTTGVTTNNTSNTTVPMTTGVPPDCTTTLKATIRDFRVSHPDFEAFTGDNAYKGLVQQSLGPDKKPVYANPGPTPQTSGPANFAQWYNNTPDVNIAFEIDIPLTEVGPDQYTYQNNAFFPIDDQGWGNEGNPHNFHFTTEIHTEFTYQGGEIFTFTGDDDLWLFINGKLAIDLGGLHPQLSDSIDLDANAGFFGIQLGGTYAMDIFHAERHTDQSNFRIDTSIKCFTIPG